MRDSRQRTKKILPYVFAIISIFFLNIIGQVTTNTLDINNPDTLVIETMSRPASIDPASSNGAFGDAIIDGVYEKLLTYGKEPKNLDGELAESWSTTSNGSSIDFNLEKGHFFVSPETGTNSGIEINAWILKYSLDRTIILADDDGPSWKMDTILNGTDIGSSTISQIDVNMPEALAYLRAGGVEVIDDWTLRINLKQANIPILSVFAENLGVAVNPKYVIDSKPLTYTEYRGVNDTADNTTAMVPLNLWFPELGENYSKLGLPADWNANDSGVVPSCGMDSLQIHVNMRDWGYGSGPYYLKVSETTYNSQIKLVKNNLWKEFQSGGWPSAPEFVLIKTVNEENSRFLDLLSGECDLTDLGISLADQVLDIERYHDEGIIEPLHDGVKVFEASTLNVLGLMMNLNSTISEEWVSESFILSEYTASNWKPYSWSTKHFTDNRSQNNNPFTNYLFRQAFAKAFDTKTYIEQAYNGFGLKAEGIIPRGMVGHHDTLIEEGLQDTYDPDGAQALFESLGWRGTITLTFNEGNTLRRVAMLLLEASIENMPVGIQIQIQEVAWPMYKAYYKTYPLILASTPPDLPDPGILLEEVYESHFHEFNYTNPVVEQMVSDAKVESDPNIRKQIYHNIEENITLDVPFIPIAQALDMQVSRDWVQMDYNSTFNSMRSLFQPWERLIKEEVIYPTTTTTMISTTTKTTILTTETTSEQSTSSEMNPSTTKSTSTIIPSISEISPGFQVLMSKIVFFIPVLWYKRKKKQKERKN